MGLTAFSRARRESEETTNQQPETVIVEKVEKPTTETKKEVIK